MNTNLNTLTSSKLWLELSELVEDRVRLACIELHESSTATKSFFITVGVGALCLCISLFFLVAAICIQVWDLPERLSILYGLGGAFILLGAGLLCYAHSYIRMIENAFSSTKQELKKDWESLCAGRSSHE